MHQRLVLLAFVALLSCLLAGLASPPSPAALAAALGPSVPVALVVASLFSSAPLALSAARSPVSLGRATLGSLWALAVSLFARVSSAAPWSPDLCVRPTGAGAPNGGYPFTILGSAGSSVRRLRVYRNNGKDGYLRGIVAFFTDGSDMRGGVRKDQFSEVAFAEREVITSMTLWATSANSSSSSSRVGRIDISTNQRSWGYGMDNTAKLSAKAVNVGSGVLVGFQGRAGDDMDQLAPIFLKELSNSVVDDIVFEKIANDDGLRLVTLREGSAVWNGTDYSWNFAGSETREVTTSFTSATSNQLALSSTFTASIPVMDSSVTAGWTLGATQTFERTRSASNQLSWGTTIGLTATNNAVSCSAMVWEGRLNVRWTGTQTVVADGASVSFPTSGTLTHVAYGKVETVCRPLSPRHRRDSTPSGSGPGPVKVAKRWEA